MTKEFATFVCQSCATLVRLPDDSGTDARGRRDVSYCRRCFGNGVFVEPRLTLEEMVRRVAKNLGAGGMADCATEADLRATIAGLERWRAPVAAPRPPSETPTRKAARLVVSTKDDEE
jgi:hypothetical protein